VAAGIDETEEGSNTLPPALLFLPEYPVYLFRKLPATTRAPPAENRHPGSPRSGRALDLCAEADTVVSMSVLAARRMHWTEAEYLSFENASATKHEYLDGEIFAMAGAPALHNRVASNTLGGLVALARGRGCGAFNSDQRIHVPHTGLHTYADGGVGCGQWEIHTDGMCLLNPMLLFEVLSPSTRDYDGGAKREHYQQIPSLRHLLLIDQPNRSIRHDWRLADGEWTMRQTTSGSIALPEFGGVLALDDVYLLEG